MSLLRFILLLMVIVAAVVGGYFYLTVQRNHAVVKQEPETKVQVQVEKKIPSNVFMEDGTLPE